MGRRLRDHRERVARLDGDACEVLEPEGSTACRASTSSGDRGAFPARRARAAPAHARGRAAVMLDDNSATENSIAVDPFQIEPGEAAQVGDAVVAALRACNAHRPQPRGPAGIAVRGTGNCGSISCMEAAPSPCARTAGHALNGHQRSAAFEGPVTARSTPILIRFSFVGRYEASNLSYCFEGRVEDGAMAGTVELGAAATRMAASSTAAVRRRRVAGQAGGLRHPDRPLPRR